MDDARCETDSLKLPGSVAVTARQHCPFLGPYHICILSAHGLVKFRRNFYLFSSSSEFHPKNCYAFTNRILISTLFNFFLSARRDVIDTDFLIEIIDWNSKWQVVDWRNLERSSRGELQKSKLSFRPYIYSGNRGLHLLSVPELLPYYVVAFCPETINRCGTMCTKSFLQKLNHRTLFADHYRKFKRFYTQKILSERKFNCANCDSDRV